MDLVQKLQQLTYAHRMLGLDPPKDLWFEFRHLDTLIDMHSQLTTEKEFVLPLHLCGYNIHIKGVSACLNGSTPTG